MDANQTKLLKQADVCRVIGVSKPTLSRWLREDRVGFPMPLFIGSRRFWRAADIEAFVASRPTGPTAAEATRPAAAE